MKTNFVFAIVVVAMAMSAAAAERPRVFVTESQALHASGDAAVGEVKGAVLVTGGSSPQNVEVMKAFAERCPGVIVTANREKADFVVRLDHEGASPTTLFTYGNKVAVFNKSEDLIYSYHSRLLSNAVKGACTAITGQARK